MNDIHHIHPHAIPTDEQQTNIQIYKKLNYFLSTNKIPNIIFHGSSGSGKKTILYNFLNKIYGETNVLSNETTSKTQNEKIESKIKSEKNIQRSIIKSNILSVNCSHGKGIKFIREDLKFFAKMNVHHSSGVKFKSIVLFNADHLTIDAQSALRRCIELFSHNTRFFIVVENMHKLLNPIVSRFCQIYIAPRSTSGENAFLSTPIDPLMINIFKHQRAKNAENRQILEHMIESLANDLTGYSAKTNVENVEYLYENGICALDILAFVKEMSPFLIEKWLNLEKKLVSFFLIKEMTKIELFFFKMKGNFRCEKLIMFHLLWKIVDMLKNASQIRK